jgi:hypothetical protein
MPSGQWVCLSPGCNRKNPGTSSVCGNPACRRAYHACGLLCSKVVTSSIAKREAAAPKPKPKLVKQAFKKKRPTKTPAKTPTKTHKTMAPNLRGLELGKLRGEPMALCYTSDGKRRCGSPRCRLPSFHIGLCQTEEAGLSEGLSTPPRNANKITLASRRPPSAPKKPTPKCRRPAPGSIGAYTDSFLGRLFGLGLPLEWVGA